MSARLLTEKEQEGCGKSVLVWTFPRQE